MAVDQLNVLIYEPDTTAQQELRRILMGFSVRGDVDLRMDRVSKPAQLVHIPQLAVDAHIALLNADDLPHSLQAGRQILSVNPQCAIIYYGSRTQDLADYFPSRPVRYLDPPTRVAVWEQALREIHEGIRSSEEHFCWTSKFCRYYIPCCQIIALRSGGGNLEVHTVGGTVYTMNAKLDEAQKRLPEKDFLRVHKSTLVNIHQIQAMDRSDKSLLLRDGSRAYISKVHYKEVTQALEAMMAQ